MPELELSYLLLFVAFVLPGAISMYVYGLLVPQAERLLKDKVLEAVCFSLVNFVLLFWMIGLVLDPVFLDSQRFLSWAIIVICFLAAPAIWPFLSIKILSWAEGRRLIGVRAKTAWDDFFGRLADGCWIQVELATGERIGGRFGKDSYASAYPDPGHLYIEELWELDSTGSFVTPLPGCPGIILRPTDYRSVRVF